MVKEAVCKIVTLETLLVQIQPGLPVYPNPAISQSA
jgi:hypothetical protein